MLLNGSPFVFVIDLAALASRREYLKLDKWLKDKLKEHQVFLGLNSLSSMAWRSVALHGINIMVISIGGGGVPAALVKWPCISLWGAFPGCLWAVLAVSGSFAY